MESDEATMLVRSCFADIISTALGRQATDSEVTAALDADPASGLAEPAGWFLVARLAGRAVGGLGVKRIPQATGELQRFYVAEYARGQGVGSALMTSAEESARAEGLVSLRLDTRSDLRAASRLYVRFGYEPTTPFNDDPHVDMWLAKSLDR